MPFDITKKFDISYARISLDSPQELARMLEEVVAATKNVAAYDFKNQVCYDISNSIESCDRFALPLPEASTFSRLDPTSTNLLTRFVSPDHFETAASFMIGNADERVSIHALRNSVGSHGGCWLNSLSAYVERTPRKPEATYGLTFEFANPSPESYNDARLVRDEVMETAGDLIKSEGNDLQFEFVSDSLALTSLCTSGIDGVADPPYPTLIVASGCPSIDYIVDCIRGYAETFANIDRYAVSISTVRLKPQEDELLRVSAVAKTWSSEWDYCRLHGQVDEDLKCNSISMSSSCDNISVPVATLQDDGQFDMEKNLEAQRLIEISWRKVRGDIFIELVSTYGLTPFEKLRASAPNIDLDIWRGEPFERWAANE